MLTALEGPQPARTLRDQLTLTGISVHEGRPATIQLRPRQAPGWTLIDEDGTEVPLERTQLVTTGWQSAVALPSGRRITMLEHLLGALSGLWLDAVAIDIIEGDACPILDGSAQPWCDAIKALGTRDCPWPRRAWCLDAVFEHHAPEPDDWRGIVLTPATAREVVCDLRFGDALPMDATAATWHEPTHSFVDQIAPARTFTLATWVDALRAQGLAKGGSLRNAVVFDRGRVVNPEGLRFTNEPARHKILDVLGDLALLGRPLVARITACGPGHRLNADVVTTLRAAADHMLTRQ